MTIQLPDLPGYELPNPEECEEYGDRLVLGAGHELFVRFRLWKERLIVEFAVMQIVQYGTGWAEVARIDTCHGSVHKHQLCESKLVDRVGQREELQKIPPDNGWTMIDIWYDRALTRMQHEWTDNLRRWRCGAR